MLKQRSQLKESNYNVGHDEECDHEEWQSGDAENKYLKEQWGEGEHVMNCDNRYAENQVDDNLTYDDDK